MFVFFLHFATESEIADLAAFMLYKSFLKRSLIIEYLIDQNVPRSDVSVHEAAL